jgi:hypothetical protein
MLHPPGILPRASPPARAVILPKIPILRLVRHAYLDLLGNWRGLVEIGGLWLIAPWVLHAVDGLLPALLGDLALTAGIAAIAVAWHRRILLQEALPKRFAPLNAWVGRYLGYSVLVVMLAAAPSLVLALLIARTMGGEAGSEQGPGFLPLLLVTLAAFASLMVAIRLQLVFPAAAIDERGETLRTSWRATRGNGWRLLAGVLLVSLPPAVAGMVLGTVLAVLSDASGSLVLSWLSQLAPIAAACVQAPLLAAFLSFGYLFLRRQQEGPVSSPPAPQE